MQTNDTKDNLLIVPVRLDALMIGAEDQKNYQGFTPPSAKFENLAYIGEKGRPFLSDLVINPPLKFQQTRDQGIHLHWHLPKTLRKGDYDQAGNLTLPDVPNRWLVTRTITASNNPDQVQSVKQWVVESDFLYAKNTYSNTSIPTQKMTSPYYQYLGRVYELEKWPGNGGEGSYYANLKAMGYGIPEFASSYANCINVFAMQDASINDITLAANESLNLSYQVVGWYDNPKNDLIQNLLISGSDNKYNWIFGEEGTQYQVDQTLYNGVVYGLEWNPNQSYLPKKAGTITPNIAIGNTPMEALSAQVAANQKGQNAKVVEQVLNALQLSTLKELGTANGTEKVAESIFNQEFKKIAGGKIWDIQPTANHDPKNQVPALPDALADQLNQLNVAQKELNDQLFLLESRQVQLFADWHKYMNAQYPDGPPPDPQKANQEIDNMANYLYSVISDINTELSNIKTNTHPLQKQIKTLKDSMQIPAQFELTEVLAPRFYEPNDPVVLLSGDGISAMPPDNDKTIACRLSGDVVTSVTLAAGIVTGSAVFPFAADKLSIPATPTTVPHGAVIQALLQEAQLINPTLSAYVCHTMAAQGGTGNPAIIDAQGTTKAYSPQGPLESGKRNRKGQPDRHSAPGQYRFQTV